MVAAVRAGESLRSVARRFHVSIDTVRRWVQHAGDARLDRVEWSDRPDGPRSPHNQTPADVEEAVLAWRVFLRNESDLGEYGAAAIHTAMERDRETGGEVHVPSVRTINRILDRRGVLDSQHRPRAVSPPRGWYLPDVADGRSELDYFDVVTGLVIADGPEVEVFNGISLHGGLAEAWPTASANAKFARSSMSAHWRRWGLPTYAQFDNDTRFQGPHQHQDVVSSVMRLCLSLGVTPVFVPPREPGFQAGMESFNAQWQVKVWHRFRHADLEAVCAQSARYASAYRAHRASRIEAAPPRGTFPLDWTLDLQAHPRGTLIYIRRTSEQGEVSLLGRQFKVDLPPHRLARCEVLLEAERIRFYRLRRREPHLQPLIGETPYVLPKRKVRGD
jgi:putative transposase